MQSDLPTGDGVAGELFRSVDWSASVLGPVAQWPTSLRTTVETVLHSRHPMFLWWGKDLIQFYNDAYLPSFGRGKHPTAMGQPGRECWPEIWPIIGPQIESVMTQAAATWHEDALVPIRRNDRIEEVYWTYAYSPVFDDDRRVGGTLVICTETTGRVIASRRQRLFRAIAEQAPDPAGGTTVLESVFSCVAEFPHDAPFAVAFDAGGVLTAVTGIASDAARRIAPDATSQPGAVRELTQPVPAGPWPEPVTHAVHVPLRHGGCLVIGISPRLSLGAEYREFFGQLADVVGHAQDRGHAIAVRAAADEQRANLYRHFMQAPFPIAVFKGPNHVVELANPQVLAAWGKTATILGLPLAEAIPELEGQPFVGWLDGVFRTGVAHEGKEQLARLPTGPAGALEDIYCNFVYAPLRDTLGAVEGILVSAAIVTDQVRARQQLERTLARAESSEAQFRDLVNNLPELAWDARADGHIEFYNTRWYDYTGTTLEQMEGWGWAAVHDPELLPVIVERWNQSLATGERFDMEFPLRRADGVFRWFLTRAIPLRDVHGQIVRWFGTNTDVDDVRRERERTTALAEKLSKVTLRLHAAQRAAKVGIVEWDLDADTVAWSPEVFWLMGLAPTAIAPSVEAAIDAILEEDRERAWRVFSEATASRAPVAETEIRLRQPDGSVRWVRLSTEIEYSATGHTTRLLGAVVDIQALKEAVDQRARALAEAERVNRAKDEFLATMSHELRTPLNAMLGWASLLKLTIHDTSKVARGLEVIERNAAMQARLISDLLDVSRIISGKLRLAVGRTEVSGAVYAAVDVVRQAADAKGVRLVVNLDPDTGALVADPDRLQQIVWNLLSNSVKFTPPGGTVTITAHRIGTLIRLRVRDTGLGIASEHLPVIFERFKQVDGTTTRAHGGLGLGLAIVRHLVEAHGGTVAVESAGLGTGAEFTVELPVRSVHAPEEHPRRVRGPAPEIASSERANRLHGVRVLVVDDEADSLELLRVVLEDAGAVVTDARSAHEALGLVSRGRFDVVISDIGMPDLDGYAFMQQLRCRGTGSDLPAIALTAYARTEDAERAFRAGYHKHMTKPVDATALLATVEQIVSRDV